MKLTRQLIEAGKTPAGAFTIHQLELLGIQTPGRGAFPARGWIDRAAGTEVPDANYREFLRQGSLTLAERKVEQKQRKRDRKIDDALPLFYL